MEKNIEGSPFGEGISPVEIERKYLVKSLPENIESYPCKEIKQGYLAVTEDGTEVRVRKKGDKYYQTVKIGEGKVRLEHEIELSEEQFEKMWGATEGRRVEKLRYKIDYDNYVIELDVYKGELDGLLTAEVEFNSEEDSNNFTPPDWFKEEVTEDERYKNKNLAHDGSPEDGIEKNKEMIPEYGLEEGVQRIITEIEEKIGQGKESVVVQIAGGSSSGKTSEVARVVEKMFGEDVLVLSLDNYYKGKGYMEEEKAKGNELNFDQPEVLDLELYRNHINMLKNGEAVEMPVYSMKKSEREDYTERVEPKKVIISEGLFTLNDTLKEEGDIRVFVETSTHGRFVRRMMRDIERTGQDPAQVVEYFSEIVEPMHQKYIENTKENANFIVKNEYNPDVEAERAGAYERQVKLKGAISPEDLRKMGAERLTSSKQVDKYYSPDDRSLSETGEIMRIREEGDKKILTYKGPLLRKESSYRERPKLEFEFDDNSTSFMKAFSEIYGDAFKVIEKERTLYTFEGTVFSLDKVFKVESGERVDLGSFVEIRTEMDRTDFNKESVRGRLKELLASTGVEVEETKTPYSSM